MQLTYRFRLRDSADAELRRQARAVNYVWNFCNEAQKHALKWGKKWPTGYQLQKLTAGSSEELGLHSHTIQRVCERYAQSRHESGRSRLRWRGKKSLGWVPFKQDTVAYRDGAFWFRGRSYRAWVSRPMPEKMSLGFGCFSQDAAGRWYINFVVEVAVEASRSTGAIGIDLGVKSLATLSDGRTIEHPAWYRRIAERLAVAQRANKKKQVRRLLAKAASQRADFLHKQSNALTRESGAIFIGNVKPSAIAKTNVGKSSLDAGWAKFKDQLRYKAIRHGVIFAEVNEAYTTQTCSQCGSIEGPKGVAGLGIREWICSCGAEHNRDTNAAQNILRRGLATLAEGNRA